MIYSTNVVHDYWVRKHIILGTAFPTILHVRSAKTRISAEAYADQRLRCLPEYTLDPWLPKGCPADTDQTAGMHRLICVFAGRTCNIFSNCCDPAHTNYVN